MNDSQAEGLRKLLEFVKRLTGVDPKVDEFIDFENTIKFKLRIELPETPNPNVP